MPELKPRKSTRLTFALSPDERDALEAVAAERDLPVATVIRHGVRLALAELEPMSIVVTRGEAA